LKDNQVRLLFLFSFKAITYAVDMTNWRQGREFILRALPGIHLHDRIVRLWDLEFDDEVVEVLEASLHVNMTASSAVSSPAFVAAAVAPGAGSQPASAASAPAVVSQPVSAASASAALGLGGLAGLSVSALRPITAELRQPAKPGNGLGLASKCRMSRLVMLRIRRRKLLSSVPPLVVLQ
jgi:hypothetical protein